MGERGWVRVGKDVGFRWVWLGGCRLLVLQRVLVCAK